MLCLCVTAPVPVSASLLLPEQDQPSVSPHHLPLHAPREGFNLSFSQMQIKGWCSMNSTTTPQWLRSRALQGRARDPTCTALRFSRKGTSPVLLSDANCPVTCAHCIGKLRPSWVSKATSPSAHRSCGAAHPNAPLLPWEMANVPAGWGLTYGDTNHSLKPQRWELCCLTADKVPWGHPHTIRLLLQLCRHLGLVGM